MTERLLKHAVEGNVTAFKGELKETFNKTLGEKLRKIESEIYKESELNEAKKTKSASKVLQLMDKDVEYSDAVKQVMKSDGIDKKQLEKELEPFI